MSTTTINPFLTEAMINAHLERTQKHIGSVQRMGYYLVRSLHTINEHGQLAIQLSEAIRKHDQSKYSAAEFIPYVWLTASYASGDRHNFKLPFGMKARITDAIQHHYDENPHHPEHWGDNLADMGLPSMAEMVCDWAAMSTEKNGGVYASPLPFYKNAMNSATRNWNFTLKQRERIEWLIVILDTAHP